ncbi:MAG: hypothetical protein GY773_34195, partial [Actinomycetia bacterium]|nr:hypothetical protein [Actinomycetes bacterium]
GGVGGVCAGGGAAGGVGPYGAALICDAAGCCLLAFVGSAGLNGLAFLLATRLPPVDVMRRKPAAQRVGEPVVEIADG